MQPNRVKKILREGGLARGTHIESGGQLCEILELSSVPAAQPLLSVQHMHDAD